jgi:hypothetical protein
VLEEIEEERQRLKLEKAEEGPSEIRGEEEEDAVLVACKDGPQKVNLALGLLRSFLYPLLC